MPLGPEPVFCAASNYLRVRLAHPAGDFDVTGVRVPYYKAGCDWRAYWAWFGPHLRQSISPRAIVIGDLNVDLARPKWVWLGEALRQAVDGGWQLPVAEGAWSYHSHRGLQSRLDHALVGPGLRVTSARYVTTNEGHLFAGPGPTRALSDHAPLVLEVA